MSKKKVLLTSGCSFTDNWWTKKYGFPVWSELLAKELDLDCINLGKRGLGNDYIFNSIIDKLATEKDRVDLVVVMWSEFARIDFEVKEEDDTDTHVKKGLPWISVSNSSNVSHTNLREVLTTFINEKDLNGTLIYRKPFEMAELIKKSLRTFYIFQEFMERMNIPYIQIIGTHPFKGIAQHKKAATHLIDSPYLDQINKKTFLGWPIFKGIGGWCIGDVLNRMENVRMSTEDSHPNQKGHKVIADLLRDNYDRRN